MKIHNHVSLFHELLKINGARYISNPRFALENVSFSYEIDEMSYNSMMNDFQRYTTPIIEKKVSFLKKFKMKIKSLL